MTASTKPGCSHATSLLCECAVKLSQVRKSLRVEFAAAGGSGSLRGGSLGSRCLSLITTEWIVQLGGFAVAEQDFPRGSGNVIPLGPLYKYAIKTLKNPLSVPVSLYYNNPKKLCHSGNVSVSPK